MSETAVYCARFPLRPLVLALLAVLSHAAVAHDAAAPTAAAASAAAGSVVQPAVDAAASSGANGTATSKAVNVLDPVYVTANRRRQNAKDVAGSVNVLGGWQLEQRGTGSIDEVAAFVPGLHVTGNSPGNQRVAIRGITTGNMQVGASVATYLDEQPVSLSNSIVGGAGVTNDVDPLDLERIEVLKGPQGSLYGASALGGLVKYVTVAPSLRSFEGRTEIGHTKRDGQSGHAARFAINLPIAKDLLAVRTTAYSRIEPGYMRDTLRGLDGLGSFKNEGARITTLLKPGASVEARLVLDHQTLKSDDAAVPEYDAITLLPRYGMDSAQRHLSEPLKNAYDRAALTVNYDLGFANLLSITSYARIKNSTTRDASPYARFIDFTSVSAFAQAGISVTALNPAAASTSALMETRKSVQEFRITSPSGGTFEWLAGVFFQEEKTGAQSAMDFFSTGSVALPSAQFLQADIRSKLQEKAAYANATYRFTNRFDLQAGLRNTSLNQDYAIDMATHSYVTNGLAAMPTQSSATHENKTTWLLSPRWVVDRDHMLYLRAASGYRPGGPNVPDTLGTLHAPLRSDSIVNYEFGYKGVYAPAKLDINAALFLIDWKDIQVTATDATSGSKYYANGGKARSRGVELDLGWQPLAGLRLSGMVSAMQAKLVEDAPAVSGRSGDDVPFTPKVSGSMSADYAWSLGDGEMSVGASVKHVAKRRVVFSHQPAAALVPAVQAPDLPAYEQVDLRASYSLDQWTLSLFVRNALNQRVPLNYDGQYVVPDVVTGSIAPATVGVSPPRTVGVSLRVDF